MSATVAGRRRQSKLHYQVQRFIVEAACIVLGLVLVVWSITPIYNMIVIALDSHDDVFSGAVWPANPSLESFRVVVTEDFWYLANFWHQFGNSFFVGLMTMFLTLLIGSLASFTVGRLHLRNGWMLTNAALMTYVIPASFLAIPFYRIMQIYGLSNHLWAVSRGDNHVRHPIRDLHLLAVRQIHPDGARRVGAHRWRQPAADLLPYLSAVDGAGIGCRGHLRLASGVE